MRKGVMWVLTASLALLALVARAAGIPISYELPEPASGEQPYLVRLVIVEKEHPERVISNFTMGTVRVAKKGATRFTEIWDGLDDNFMPVPPGEYAVRGICAPATKSPLDGTWHAIHPRFVGGVSPWLPTRQTPESWKVPVGFYGDPVNSPLRDVDSTPDGIAVFYYQYLENGRNAPMFDLNRPLGREQFLRAFNSGGVGGGFCATTDGETVWAVSTDGTPDFIYRPDGKNFGPDSAPFRKGGLLPGARVIALSSQKTDTGSVLYVLMRGKLERLKGWWGGYYYDESKTPFDQLWVLDGETGKRLAELAVPGPGGMAARNGRLWLLYHDGADWTVGSYALKNGLPEGKVQPKFKVPKSIEPADLEVDPEGFFYLSDTAKNRAYRLDGSGRIVQTFGRSAAQTPGQYDPETMMAPAKLAVRRTADGSIRLLVVELEGPNRVSEWDVKTGRLALEYPTYQTRANTGYACDPDDPSLVYVSGHGNWMVRWKVDLETGVWKTDAVWPGVFPGDDQKPGLAKPRGIRRNGRFYLASERSGQVYRLSDDGRALLFSAAIIREGDRNYFWNDANGNGKVDREELRPCELPPGVLSYHGQKWLDDLSYIAAGQGTRDVMRLAPAEFDRHGNPVFRSWEKVLTDPFFTARAEGNAPALRGGNELDDRFSSDWLQVDGTPGGDYYVQARGGRNFTANYGAQHKISRYVPDGKGGYQLRWRVGRTRLEGAGKPGEIHGAMRIFRPINGLLAVIDQTRSGVLLYTEDGIYLDTIFPPDTFSGELGVYRQPGEFFAGSIWPNPKNRRIYYAAGKYTPYLYEFENWTLDRNPVKPVTGLPEKVTVSAAEIADPPELALALRGGAGAARFAEFAPSTGIPAFDGSLTGWEAASPVVFKAGDQRTVEVRCLYQPERLFLRWHLRFDFPFQPVPLTELARIFSHDQAAVTFGFYLRGDAEAPAGGPAGGRPGDVRFTAGVFQRDGKVVPVMIGMYPEWSGAGARPQTYRTPVGSVSFAHVGEVAGAKLAHRIDPDGKGLVLTAMIPRSAIPARKQPFNADFRTLVNFDANFGGHNRVWWANTDGSANIDTYDEPSEARLYPGAWAPVRFDGFGDGPVPPQWLILGPFGGPGAEKFTYDPSNKQEVEAFYRKAKYSPEGKPVDRKARYQGPEISGFWGAGTPLSWQVAGLDEVDNRVKLGLGSQVWFGVTWVWSPEAVKVPVNFLGHWMTYIDWTINGKAFPIPDKDYRAVDNGKCLAVAQAPVQLRKGWNEFRFRAFCVGCPPFKIGLQFKVPMELAWKLRFSVNPER